MQLSLLVCSIGKRHSICGHQRAWRVTEIGHRDAEWLHDGSACRSAFHFVTARMSITVAIILVAPGHRRGAVRWSGGHRRGPARRCRPHAELSIVRDANGRATSPLIERRLLSYPKLRPRCYIFERIWPCGTINRTRHGGESARAAWMTAYSEMFAVMNRN
jgi:hypothetical protein